MDTLRVFIVDDERLARDELRFLLLTHPEAVVVGEADTVAIAIEAIDRLRPDVVFLDLQLRGESGLQVLEHCPNPSSVVFVTGFEEQSLQALEAREQSYLLKPVNPERLSSILGHFAQP